MKSEMSRKSDMFHPYTLVIHPDFKELGDFILSLPERFEKNEGIVIHKGRNELRKMEYGGREYVVKSFHRPNIINCFVSSTNIWDGIMTGHWLRTRLSGM